jgi:hypothetical protein
MSTLNIIEAESPGFFDVGPADQVSLAPGKIDQNEVGLAWRSDAKLSFTTVSLTAALPLSPDVTPLSASDSAFATQILYQDSGFAKAEPMGGWFLSWVETASDGTLVSQIARVRDVTQDVVSQRTLGSGVRVPTLLYPTSIGEVANVGYALITSAGPNQTEVHPSSIWCH